MSQPPKRIVFAGSPDFAVLSLKAMLDAGLNVVGVISQPDSRAGRHRKLRPTPVKSFALQQGLRVMTPDRLSKADEIAELQAMQPTIMVVVAYGLILPETVLGLPPQGCINAHASLLPRWRGASPIERAIIAGDAETGISIIQLDAGIDTGGVRLARPLPIGHAETGGELAERLAPLAAELLLKVLMDPHLYPPRVQTEQGACYARQISRADCMLDFSAPADLLARTILALNPRRPATITTSTGSPRLRLLRAHALPDVSPEGAAPGQLLALEKQGAHLATGAGVLCVWQAQLVEGKGSILSGADLHNALSQRLTPGAQFFAC